MPLANGYGGFVIPSDSSLLPRFFAPTKPGALTGITGLPNLAVAALHTASMSSPISAVTQVYNAGGYVGVQMVDDAWLVTALDEIKRRGGEKVFGRMFLIPHPYGLNHPPDYTADTNGVLGFLDQARIVSDTIGFVPPMIAGEGGWKWNATDDANYPPIDAERHRDYHLEVFNWFRTGQLSNGQPLPDTLLAFCPWLLSSKLDDSAWFDSFYGDHTPTIDAVKALPVFQRRFSWE